MPSTNKVSAWTKIMSLHEKNVAERGTKLDWDKIFHPDVFAFSDEDETTRSRRQPGGGALKMCKGFCCSACFLAFLFSISGAIILQLFATDALSDGQVVELTKPQFDFFAKHGTSKCEDAGFEWACFYTYFEEERPRVRLSGLLDVDNIPVDPKLWDTYYDGGPNKSQKLKDVFNVLGRMDFEFIEDDPDTYETDYVYVDDTERANSYAQELLRPRPDTTAYTFGPDFYMNIMATSMYWEVVDNILNNTAEWQQMDLTTNEARVEAIQYMLPTVTETYPYDEQTYNRDVMSVWISFILTWVLGYIITRDATKAAKYIMVERQNGTKQLMEFLGLEQIEYWASQFYTQMAEQLPPVFVSWIIILPILLDVDDKNDLDLGFGQCLYVLFLMLNLLLNVTLYAFACSSLVRKDALYDAWSLVSSLMFCFLPVISMISNVNQESTGQRLMLQWIPLFNFAFGVRDSYTEIHGDTIFFHFFNTFLWGFLTLYLDLTIPTLKGAQARACCFCFRKKKDAISGDVELGDTMAKWRKLPEDERPLLVIKNLKKYFGQFPAVGGVSAASPGLSLELKTDQIYGLLGFNGAGKSTTINMITGQLKPTSGNIFIDGHDVATEIETLRQMMGVCPQMNILWDKLTVMEHLQLFGKLRGFDDEQITRESEQLLKELELDHRTHNLAGNLSGGEKRKLMVCAAFLGDPPFILLDEPTAGVDVDSRDSIQNLIIERKKDKLIILTTHHMSEADYLADDIAIMAEGVIAIKGNPTQLKVEHGAGTTFLIKAPTFTAGEVEGKFDVDVSTDQDGYRHVNCKNIQEVPDILAILEQHAKPGEIKIENNSLESVFLNLAKQKAKKENRRSTVHAVRASRSMSSRSKTNAEKKNIRVQKAGYGALDQELMGGDAPFDTSASNNDKIAQASKKKYERPGLMRQVYLLSYKRFMVIRKDIAPILRGLMIIVFMAVLYLFFMSAIGWIDTPDDFAEISDLTNRDDNKIPVYGEDLRDQLPVDVAKYVYEDFGFYVGGDPPVIENYEDQPEYGGWEVRKQPNIVIPSVVDAVPVDGARRAVYTGAQGTGTLEYVEESEERYVRCVNPTLLECVPLYSDCDSSNEKYTYAKAYEQCQNYGDGYRLPTGNEPDTTVYTTENGATTSGVMCQSVGTDASCGGDYWTSDRAEEYRTNSFTKHFAMLSPYYEGEAQSQSRYGYAGQYAVQLTNENVNTADLLETIIAAFFFMMGSAMMVVALYKYSAHEIETGMFEQQVLMGVSKWTLYAVAFAWDFIICLFSVSIYILITNPDSTAFKDTMAAWIPSSISFILVFYTGGAYMDYARLNTVTTAGILIIVTFALVVVPLIDTGLFAKVLAIKHSDYDSFEDEDFGDITESTVWIFRLPFYATPPFMYMLTQILFSFGDQQELDSSCYTNHWLLFFFEGTLLWILLFWHSQQKWKKDPEYEEVAVLNKDLTMQYNSDNVVSDTISKVFTNEKGEPFAAVNQISFSETKGRTMGVLGKNGAGKSTMMNMLSTLFPPSYGKGTVHGKDVVDDAEQIRKFSGICNQKNIYWRDFTVHEHLTYFGQLRGVPADEIEALINVFADELKFIEHMETQMHELSGGNKRKVLLCTSVLGTSDVLYLDEPSAGVDPFARDEMKNVLVKLKDGRTCLFTSHTMEEAEIMCDDVVIMVKGKMEATGEVNQLITDYSDGYTLQVDTSDITDVQSQEIKDRVMNLGDVEQHDATKAELNFTVKFSVPLSKVFTETLSIEKEYGVISIVESANLGQLFKHVVRDVEEDHTPAPRKSKTATAAGENV